MPERLEVQIWRYLLTNFIIIGLLPKAESDSHFILNVVLDVFRQEYLGKPAPVFGGVGEGPLRSRLAIDQHTEVELGGIKVG